MMGLSVHPQQENPTSYVHWCRILYVSVCARWLSVAPNINPCTNHSHGFWNSLLVVMLAKLRAGVQWSRSEHTSWTPNARASGSWSWCFLYITLSSPKKLGGKILRTIAASSSKKNEQQLSALHKYHHCQPLILCSKLLWNASKSIIWWCKKHPKPSGNGYHPPAE